MCFWWMSLIFSIRPTLMISIINSPHPNSFILFFFFSYYTESLAPFFSSWDFHCLQISCFFMFVRMCDMIVSNILRISADSRWVDNTIWEGPETWAPGGGLGRRARSVGGKWRPNAVRRRWQWAPWSWNLEAGRNRWCGCFRPWRAGPSDIFIV